MRSISELDVSVAQSISLDPAGFSPRRSPLSPEDLAAARALWLAASRAKSIRAESLAAWMILRGKDPKKAFSPITNPVKLANGAKAWGAYEQALRLASGLSPSALEPWAPLLSEAGCARAGERPWSPWKPEGHPILKAISAFSAPKP